MNTLLYFAGAIGVSIVLVVAIHFIFVPFTVYNAFVQSWERRKVRKKFKNYQKKTLPRITAQGPQIRITSHYKGNIS